MFVTFTFNPKKVNRYDLNACYLKMQSWLWRQQKKSNNEMKYIIVPEKHKDGAIHFHAVMSNYPGMIKKTNVIQNNRRVYNLTSFRFGFSNMQYLDDDKQKVAAYVCKYITKDMITVSNRRRYWASKNLQKHLKTGVKYWQTNLKKPLNIQVLAVNLELTQKSQLNQL